MANDNPNVLSSHSQTMMILARLRAGGTITQREAAQDYGCYRLSARIWDIRNMGFEVPDVMESALNRYGDKVSFKRYGPITKERKIN